MKEYAELQALVAELYGLTPRDFEHVLSTFPLVPERTKAAALSAFEDVHGSKATESRKHGVDDASGR
jgi:hypothetical protein